MDSRVVEWKKTGLMPSEVPGLSLAERELFVTKDNVWGFELWNEWRKKGIKGEDLYYIYKVKQILPESISRSRIEVQQGELYYLYEDYVEQVYAIKLYLLEKAMRGELNYSSWLRDLYIEKGWAKEISSIYGKRVEYDSEEIGWEEVVTPELERFVNSFKWVANKRAFEIEYYCQGFPAHVSEGIYNPRINIEDDDNGLIKVEIKVSDYEYTGVYESKEAFMGWLKSGGFADKYYKDREQFYTEDYVTVDSEKVNGVSTQMQDGGKLCTIRQYRLTPNNVRVYQVEDSKGNRVEMSEGAIRDGITEGKMIVHGLDIGSTGKLHWLRAPQLIK